VFPIPVQAACSAPPSDGYKLPGVMLTVEHDASGECFNVWLDQQVEIGSWLLEGRMTSPKLVIQTSVFNYNNHNPVYGWGVEQAVFVDSAIGNDIKPGDIVAGDISVMKVTIQHEVDNRPREWSGWAGNLTKIDIGDITKVVTAWGMSFSDIGYKPNQDVYPDGFIDILDLLSVVEVWGPTIYDTFEVVSSYAPGSCSDFNRYSISVSFENDSGNELTFWTEARFGDQWFRGNYIEVPDNTGGDIDHQVFEQPDEVRLMIASFDMQTVSNISWLVDCDYAPPSVIKITGQPDPFSQGVMDEADSAGTLFEVATQAEADDLFLLTSAQLVQMGSTEAQIEASTGWDVRIVPNYSVEQTASLMFKVPCCMLFSGIWFDGPIVHALEDMVAWIPGDLRILSLLDRHFPPPILDNKITEGGPWHVGHTLSGTRLVGVEHCIGTAMQRNGQNVGGNILCKVAP
jgi:hypothetical protein